MKNKKTKFIYLSLAILFIFIPLKIVSANSLSASDSEYCKYDPVLKECNWFPGQCPQEWKNVESPLGVSTFPAAPSGKIQKRVGCLSITPVISSFSKYFYENFYNPLDHCKYWYPGTEINSVRQISGVEYPDYCRYPVGEAAVGNVECKNGGTEIMMFECLKSENTVPYLFCCPPPSCSISASPSSITSGQSSILIWSSKGANSFTPSGFTASALSGSASVSPSATTTYKLTVSNGKGGQVICETTINVKEPPKPLPVISGPCQNLVPCGTSKNPEDCTLRHIFVMIQNIVNCLVFISTIICLLFIVIGGLLYIFSLGNPENLTKAKNTILWALGGLALVFLAWLIVNTVMHFMGVGGGFLMWSSVG